MRNLAILAAIALTLSFSVKASAELIDFRNNDPWENGDTLSTYTQTLSGDLAGIEITVAPSNAGATLWHDDVDGIGVREDYEADEIEGAEVLQVTFSQPVVLDEILISDLFWEPRSGQWYLEEGSYRINDGEWIDFQADAADPYTFLAKNGEIGLDISNMTVESISFRAPGYVWNSEKGYTEDHDFALQGLVASPVPETCTIFLLGSALAALMFAGRTGRTSRRSR